MFKSIYQKKLLSKVFTKYKKYTMIPKDVYIENLKLVNNYKHIKGCIVECGTWRGGMIAGIADVIGDKKKYYLYDSFDGLPLVEEIDGQAAKNWQGNTSSPYFFDNCKAQQKVTEQVMRLSKAKDYYIIKGWFSDTLPNHSGKNISILRLDGDWYKSTFECLSNLYPYVNKGGIVIIDDYYVWEGCSKAVHDYISINKLNINIKQYNNKVCFIEKK